MVIITLIGTALFAVYMIRSVKHDEEPFPVQRRQDEPPHYLP